MPKVKFEIITKMVPANYIVIDDEEFDYGDFIGVLEGLADADGFTNRIFIYNADMGKMLEKYGVAVKTNRGSYRRGEEYEQFIKLFPDHF